MPLKGILKLSSDLPAITDGVVIHDPSIAAGGRQDVEIDGNGHEIFAVQALPAGITVTISDLKLTKGQSAAGGAINIDVGAGSVTLDNLVVTHNQAIGHLTGFASNRGLGGGIAVVTGSALIENCQITKNAAVGFDGRSGSGGHKGDDGGVASGGGIEVSESASLDVRNSIISKNVAKGGTAGRGSNGRQTSSSIWSATAGSDGGNAYGGGIANLGVLILEKTQIETNLAKGGRGGNGGHGQNAGPKVPIDAHSLGGAGGQGGFANGGGVSNQFGASATITDSTISSNKAIAGNGGNGGNGGTAKTIGAGGSDGGDGGDGGVAAGCGIESSHGSLDIEDSSIVGNRGLGGKGGSGGKATIPGAHAGKTALHLDVLGGGIYSSNGTLSLSQVTIAINSAFSGGGISIFYDSSVRIANSTIARNIVSGLGGGIDITSSSVTIVSTIVALNISHFSPDIDGEIVVSHSLIQHIAGVQSATLKSDTIVGVDPLLGPLQMNGGLTPTMCPSLQSPVIGKGDNPDQLTTDQRGLARVLPAVGGAIDIGAVELG